MTIDISAVAQNALVAGLVGLVAAVWAATITLARLATRLKVHEEQDAREFARLDAEVREVAEIARAALYQDRP